LPEKDILGVKIAVGRKFIFRIQEDNLVRFQNTTGFYKFAIQSKLMDT